MNRSFTRSTNVYILGSEPMQVGVTHAWSEGGKGGRKRELAPMYHWSTKTLSVLTFSFLPPSTPLALCKALFSIAAHVEHLNCYTMGTERSLAGPPRKVTPCWRLLTRSFGTALLIDHFLGKIPMRAARLSPLPVRCSGL